MITVFTYGRFVLLIVKTASKYMRVTKAPKSHCERAAFALRKGLNRIAKG